jgi:hypothetical protein
MRYAPTSLTNYVLVLVGSWAFLAVAVKQPLRFEFDLANIIAGWLLATVPAIATWRFYKLSAWGCLPALVSKCIWASMVFAFVSPPPQPVYAETRIAGVRIYIDKFLLKPFDPYRFDIFVYRPGFPGIVEESFAGSLPGCAVPRLTATQLLLDGCDLPPISLAELARTRKLPPLPR